MILSWSISGESLLALTVHSWLGPTVPLVWVRCIHGSIIAILSNFLWSASQISQELLGMGVCPDSWRAPESSGNSGGGWSNRSSKGDHLQCGESAKTERAAEFLAKEVCFLAMFGQQHLEVLFVFSTRPED